MARPRLCHTLRCISIGLFNRALVRAPAGEHAESAFGGLLRLGINLRSRGGNE